MVEYRVKLSLSRGKWDRLVLDRGSGDFWPTEPCSRWKWTFHISDSNVKVDGPFCSTRIKRSFQITGPFRSLPSKWLITMRHGPWLIYLGIRRWNWKLRGKHFLNPNPELLLLSSYSFWPWPSTSGSDWELASTLPSKIVKNIKSVDSFRGFLRSKTITWM